MGALIELLDRKLAKCPTLSLFLSPTNKVSKGLLKHPPMDAFGDKVIQEAGTQPGTHDSRVCVCVFATRRPRPRASTSRVLSS